MFKIYTDDIPPTLWKNGGGLTRNLWVSDQFRISLADIEQDGPFSAFPDMTRHFCVIEGEGVFLEFGYDSTRLTPHSAPFTFDGNQAPYCRLINGKTRDVNMMVREGVGKISHQIDQSFSHQGFLALENAVGLIPLDFLWFGTDAAPKILTKGLWFGYNP